MKRTINELAAYFDLPYQVVHKVVFPIKKYAAKNQTFDTEIVRQLLIERFQKREAEAMERMADYAGRIRRLESMKDERKDDEGAKDHVSANVQIGEDADDL